MDLVTAAPQARLARRVADYICGVRFEDLDPAAVDRAKEQLIYHAGLAFSGALTDHGRQAIDVARLLAEGRGRTTIVGQSFRVPPLEAAFASLQDATLAAAYAQLAAHALGLSSVWIGMIDEQEVMKALGTDLVPSSILCIGYPFKMLQPKPKRSLIELIHEI